MSRWLAVISALACGAAAAQEAEPAPQDVEVIVTPPPTLSDQEQALAEAAETAEVKDPTPPPAAFVKGEGFRLLSADGNYKLRVGLQAAASYVPTFTNLDGENGETNNWSQFRVPFARLRVDGHLYKTWIRYWFSFEFSGFPPFLLDGYLEAQPHTYFGVRLGQFFTPISRHEYLGPQELLFPDWAIVADYFWPGRDKGVQFFGEGDLLSWYAGLFAGSGLRQTVTTPGHFQLMSRVTVTPLGKLGWGEIPYVMAEDEVPFRIGITAQGYWSKLAPSSLGFNSNNGFYQRTEGPEQFQGALSGGFLAQWDRFGFDSELYFRRIESTTTPTEPFWQAGFWAHANYTFYKRILDVAMRFNWIDPSNALGNDNFTSVEAQISWFVMAPYVILRLRYAVGHQQNPGEAPATNPDLYNVVKLPFTAGTGHQVTVQASAYF